MTDPQQAARIAAMRARRGQSPVAIPTSEPARPAVSWAPPTATAADVAQAHMVVPTPTPEIRVVREAPARAQAPKEKGRHPHVAAGARILVTGLTASSIFGLTSVIASANRPIVPAADPSQVASAENTAATVATTAPLATDPAPVASAAPVPTVLTLPPAVSTVNSQQAAAQPASSGSAAPAPKPAKAPAKAPTTTKAPAPATTQPPPPPATTKASG